MPVNTEHPLYVKRKKQWKVMRDCVEGEDAIKDAGEEYLPKASGSTIAEYQAYKKRARFVNYTARTLTGLHGLVFRRKPVIEMPDEMLFLLKDIDRRGTNVYQFTSDVFYDTLITGYGGILDDYPQTNGAISKKEAEDYGIRPYFRYYPAESIINWQYGVVNGSEKLTKVVLEEVIDSYEEDEFEATKKVQYRVLELEDGVYRQRLISEVENGFVEDVIPIFINGKSLDEIPFKTFPSRLPEKPMGLDLAYCNIGHYQKSADYENGVHMTTIPTGYVTGHELYTDEKTGEQEQVRLGQDAFLVFPNAESKVGTLCFSGEGLSHSEEALRTAMDDMAILGSRLVAPDRGVTESGDSAKIHRAGENAILSTFANNFSENFTALFKIVADWLGIDANITFRLCTDYDTLQFDPNALNALANLAEAGKLPMPYVYWNLKNGEYAPADSSYEEYATLLSLEQQGVEPLEIMNTYKQMKEQRNSNYSA